MRRLDAANRFRFAPKSKKFGISRKLNENLLRDVVREAYAMNNTFRHCMASRCWKGFGHKQKKIRRQGTTLTHSSQNRKRSCMDAFKEHYRRRIRQQHAHHGNIKSGQAHMLHDSKQKTPPHRVISFTKIKLEHNERLSSSLCPRNGFVLNHYDVKNVAAKEKCRLARVNDVREKKLKRNL